MKKLILCTVAIIYCTIFALSAQAEQKKQKTKQFRAPQPKALQDPVNKSPLSQLKVIRNRLDNGLRIVMSPDSTVPIVAVAIYYDVGSRNEVKGRSGFAHLFEHMMFQGSQNIGKMEHFQFVTKRGGDANGSTSHDRTNYYQTLPSSELELGLWLEADRMRSLAVTQENFENQRKTVMEERRQSYDNQPYMKSMLRINELAYGDYWPYAHSTIGDMADLKNAPLDAVKNFFNSYYRPNNAVLSLAGDFKPEEALKLIKKYFGDIEPGKIPEYKPAPPKPQKFEKVEQMVDEIAELPAFHIAYHIPPDRHPDHYPLEIMEIVLADGESSRLYQILIKKRQILQEIHAGTDGRRGPDLFSFWAICAKGQSGAKARQEIYLQLEDIAQKGIASRELEKAKNRVRAAFVFGMRSNLLRSMRLAEYEMYYGNASLVKTELERYLEITSEDVKRVTSQYFSATNRTVLEVLPRTLAKDDRR